MFTKPLLGDKTTQKYYMLPERIGILFLECTYTEHNINITFCRKDYARYVK